MHGVHLQLFFKNKIHSNRSVSCFRIASEVVYDHDFNARYLLLLHDLYRANFENRVRGAGVARWRT